MPPKLLFEEPDLAPGDDEILNRIWDKVGAEKLPARRRASASMPAIPEPPHVRLGDLYAAFLADAKSPETRRAREQDTRDLAKFLGLDDPQTAAAGLVNSGSGRANAIALAYRRSMQDRGLSAATIDRRLCTIRRVVEFARRFDLADWSIDVQGPKVEP
jgi:hypothetical protein